MADRPSPKATSSARAAPRAVGGERPAPSPASSPRALVTGRVASAAQKASGIGPPGVGAHYLPPEGGPRSLLDVVGTVLGPERPPTVAAADPYGITAWEQGKGPPPMLLGTTEPVDPLRAYHGSPHIFEPEPGYPLGRFRAEKIGTGEGAQAYGHGLYFAQHPDVALDYKNKLGSGLLVHGVQPEAESIRRALEFVDRDLLRSHGSDVAIRDAITRTARQADFYRRTYAGGDPSPNLYDHAVERLKTLQPESLSLPGKTYEVDLHVDPAHLLDWDRPLREQTPHVQEALRGANVRPSPIAWHWQPHQVTPADVQTGVFGPRAEPGQWAVVQRDATGTIQYHGGTDYVSEQAAGENARARQAVADVSPRDRGGNLYRDLQSATGGGGRASELLHEAGVPGLRYLDQGSRAAGRANVFQASSGNWLIPGSSTAYPTREAAQAALDASGNLTSNYVIFPGAQHLIDILRTYGVLPPLVPALGGAALEALRQGHARDQVATPPPAPPPSPPVRGGS